ncbi:VVA0879 family protein [Nonomuraea sp. NPDC050404]|uniref:VVA0879 family protein n=1 Tax=Nonomuraea sp. NPDC050404 TaxID=3155783 RepID=UPI0033DBDAC3
MSEHRKLTQAELLAEAQERFGDDPLDFAFKCPHCGDVATIRDFPEDKREAAGQECIGRSLGATRGERHWDSKGVQRGQAKRGCDWAAYGLLRGPWEVVMEDGRSVWGFPLADAPAAQPAGGAE